MKNLITFSILLLFSFLSLSAQHNTNLLGNLTYTHWLSDVWGYAANGKEYALVGVRDGLSIVDVTVPTNPTEVDFIQGGFSVWRDIKTFGNYAYAIADEGSEGLLIMDLSTLPGTVNYHFYKPSINGTPLGNSHNLYIDEYGYIYLAAVAANGRGTVILDPNQNAWNPPVVALCDPTYSHDVYVRDNILYNSEIYEGVFTAYDVSDKNNITFLGSHDTPYQTTHNTWLSDDGKTLYTADESADAPIGVYDVTNLNDIKLIQEYRPPSTIGKGESPHNVHVFNDFLVISFYDQGVIIVDASRPHNLIEVGRFSDGVGLVWGAYPFLPSGNLLISDMDSGMFVLGANYERACFLEGKVTDAITGDPIPNASVNFFGGGKITDIAGDYEIGVADAGTYSLMVSSTGYNSKTINNIALVNGQATQVDVQLSPIGSPNQNIQASQYSLEVRPNPTNDVFTVDFELAPNIKDAKLIVSSILGRVLETIDVTNQMSSIQLGGQLNAGIYIAQIISPTSKSKPVKVIKVN